MGCAWHHRMAPSVPRSGLVDVFIHIRHNNPTNHITIANVAVVGVFYNRQVWWCCQERERETKMDLNETKQEVVNTNQGDASIGDMTKNSQQRETPLQFPRRRYSDVADAPEERAAQMKPLRDIISVPLGKKPSVSPGNGSDCR